MAEKESKTAASTPALVKKSVEGIGALKPQNSGESSSGGQGSQGSSGQSGSTNGGGKG